MLDRLLSLIIISLVFLQINTDVLSVKTLANMFDFKKFYVKTRTRLLLTNFIITWKISIMYYSLFWNPNQIFAVKKYAFECSNNKPIFPDFLLASSFLKPIFRLIPVTRKFQKMLIQFPEPDSGSLSTHFCYCHYKIFLRLEQGVKEFLNSKRSCKINNYYILKNSPTRDISPFRNKRFMLDKNALTKCFNICYTFGIRKAM